MIDLYEKHNGKLQRVAVASLEDVARMGVRRFFKVQELLERKIVYVREEEDETQSK